MKKGGKGKESKKSLKKDESQKKLEEEEKEKEKEEAKELAESTGYGRFEYIEGASYTGNWKLINEKTKVKHGFGKLIQGANDNKDGIAEEYEGEWDNDQMHGYGVLKYMSGALYSGNWKNNKQQGFGVYQFADGSKYEGEWDNHVFHGNGKYTDIDNTVWEGEFVHGYYETKNQKKLQAERMMTKLVENIKESSVDFFRKFSETFKSSDKKSFKENLIPFFGNNDNLAEYMNEPYPKYEEKAPDKWNDVFNFMSESRTDNELNIKVLKNSSSSSFISEDRLHVDQLLTSGGQIVELSVIKEEEREAQISLCQTNEGKWVLAYFHEVNHQQPKKK